MKETMEKIKTTAINWTKKFGCFILIVFGVVLALFTGKKIDVLVRKHDTKQKEDIKSSVDDLKEDITDAKETVQEAETKAEEIKEEIKEDQKEADKAEKDYFSEQQEIAEAAGFKKKTKK